MYLFRSKIAECFLFLSGNVVIINHFHSIYGNMIFLTRSYVTKFFHIMNDLIQRNECSRLYKHYTVTAHVSSQDNATLVHGVIYRNISKTDRLNNFVVYTHGQRSLALVITKRILETTVNFVSTFQYHT